MFISSLLSDFVMNLKWTGLLKMVGICLFVGACGSVSKEEFITLFKQLGDRRLKFRHNMKALADSSLYHQRFARMTLQEVWKDSVMDSKFKGGYLAYHDSLRQAMVHQAAYFENQQKLNRPFISRWEKVDMDFDRVVQGIKSGELSEDEGLELLNRLQQEMHQVVTSTDSISKDATTKYWDFRKTHDEYRVNLHNLKVLYSRELYGFR